MDFKEEEIVYGEFADNDGPSLSPGLLKYYENRKYGDTFMADAASRMTGKRKAFSQMYMYMDHVSPTLTAHTDSLIPYHKPKFTSKHEACCIASFPQDYEFGNNRYHELCGRSVPPVMMANIASNVYDQWLSKLS